MKRKSLATLEVPRMRLVTVATLLLLAGCTGEPAAPKGAPASQPAASPELPDLASGPVRKLAAAPYQQSFVTLVGHSGGAITASTFERFEAELTAEGERPQALEVRIRTLSGVGSDARAVTALRGKDFLESGKHPVATFRSTEVSRFAPGRYAVAGSLELRGKKHEVRVPVTARRDGGALVIEGRFTMDADDWTRALDTKHDLVFRDRLDVMLRLQFPLAQEAR